MTCPLAVPFGGPNGRPNVSQDLECRASAPTTYLPLRRSK